MWRLLRTALPMGYKYSWSELLNPWCPHSCPIIESPFYLFWDCPTAQYQWSFFLQGWDIISATEILSWDHILNHTISPTARIKRLTRHAFAEGFGIVVGCICYRLWMNRNAIKHESPVRRDPFLALRYVIANDIKLHFQSSMRRTHGPRRYHFASLRKILIASSQIYAHVFQ